LVIAAAHKFGCAHRFVVTKERNLFSFICELCEHRVEELPLVTPRAAATAAVISFPTPHRAAPGNAARAPRRASKSSHRA
jgi:hypothetical protein